MRVLFEYPVSDDSAFSLKVPKGAKVIDAVTVNSVLGESFSLVVLVDANEPEGEELFFFRARLGDEMAFEQLEYVGQLGAGDFLWVATARGAIRKE
jgi:hypothetical protein